MPMLIIPIGSPTCPEWSSQKHDQQGRSHAPLTSCLRTRFPGGTTVSADAAGGLSTQDLTMVAKAQPKTRWGKAGTPNKIQSPRPAKNRAETTLVRHLTDHPPSAKSVRRVGRASRRCSGLAACGVSAACSIWASRRASRAMASP